MDQERVGHDVRARHRQRQRRAVAVVDPAAHGRDVDRRVGLGRPHGRIPPARERLDPDEPQRQRREHEDHDGPHDTDPSALDPTRDGLRPTIATRWGRYDPPLESPWAGRGSPGGADGALVGLGRRRARWSNATQAGAAPARRLGARCRARPGRSRHRRAVDDLARRPVAAPDRACARPVACPTGWPWTFPSVSRSQHGEASTTAPAAGGARRVLGPSESGSRAAGRRDRRVPRRRGCRRRRRRRRVHLREIGDPARGNQAMVLGLRHHARTGPRAGPCEPRGHGAGRAQR